MKTSPSAERAHPSQSLLRFRRASQAVHATHSLDEVLARTIAELHSALDADAASVALIDERDNETILHAAGPVAEKISGLRLPPERGIISWVISNGRSALINDVSLDDRFWSEVDGYSGFETRSVLCVPLFTGKRIIGAIEILNKHHGGFSIEDLNFLEAFSAVAASAIESARSFEKEQWRRRGTSAMRHAWEILTVPRTLDDLLEVILDQLRLLIEYRSASILLVTEQGGLELGACRGIDDPDAAAQVASALGIDAKVHVMLETRKPLLIPDTRADTRWQHFPGFSYIRSWIGAPLMVKGHLIGTLNLDHDLPDYYDEDHLHLVMDYAHQVAIAIENSRLYATTHEVTVQLATQARRMVTLYEASRSLLSGLELDSGALRELVHRFMQLIGTRYGILNIQADYIPHPMLIAVSPTDQEPGLDLAVIKSSIFTVLNCEQEIVRSSEFEQALLGSLPAAIANSFLGVAIHARGQLWGRLLFADKIGDNDFNQDDEALALVLAANLASAVENASLYQNTQQRLREISALYQVSHSLTAMTNIADVYTHLAAQVAKLHNAEICALFLYRDGVLKCQPSGYGLSQDVIPYLDFRISDRDPLYAFIQAPEPLIINAVMQDPDLVPFYPLLDELGIRRMLSCRLEIDEDQVGLLLVADKRGGEEFGEQDRHLASIMAHQVSNVLQRALLQNHQHEQTQIQSALLQVSHAISSLTDLDELLHTITQITYQLVGCDHCMLAPWEERVNGYVPRAQYGLDEQTQERLIQMTLQPADFYHMNLAIETREPVLLGRSEIRDTIPSWARRLLGVEHSLVVPLVVQDRVVGLIVGAFSSTNHPPGEREIALVTGIARQAAIAIENANLYQNIQLHALQLERAYQDLKGLDERKTQFIQNVSHELRTPLTIIKGYLELLQEEETGTLSGRQREALSIIADKVTSLDKLILDIVAVQSIDATSLELCEFDLSVLLRPVLAHTELNDLNMQLRIDLGPGLPNVYADPNMVERVLNHLMENAIKFSPDGGVITVSARPEGDEMVVEVQDQGIGIPEHARDHLFDRFYQVDGSTTRRFRGTGVGLSMIKQIVQAHGGDVGVRSTEGEGSTFFFTLPLASSDHPRKKNHLPVPE
jgi:GAF domain-containing protein/anti-sigma regulatory factor (Ser/Thr protein kinase)